MKIYVDKNALQDYTTKLIAKEKTIFATKDQVGSPLVASTVAGMTDHDKIYVYVGSETGYTSGNWYYWDGSAWVSGGIYNSEGFVLDDTLTSATLPAQAKAVGDKVSQLSEDITQVDSLFVFVEQGYWNAADGAGGVTANWCRTRYFLPRGIVLDNSTILKPMFLQAWNASTGAYVGTWNGTTFGNTAPTDVASGYLKHINVDEWTSDYPNYKFKVTWKGGSAITPSDVYEMLTVTSSIVNNSDGIESITARFDESAHMALEIGGISGGTPSVSSTYVRNVDFVKAKAGDTLTVSPTDFAVIDMGVYKYSEPDTAYYTGVDSISNTNAGNTRIYTFVSDCYFKIRAAKSSYPTLTKTDIPALEAVFTFAHEYDYSDFEPTLKKVYPLPIDYETIKSGMTGKINIGLQTDTHISAFTGYQNNGTKHAETNFTTFEKVLTSVEQLGVDAFVNLGDLVRGYEFDSDYETRETIDRVIGCYNKYITEPKLLLIGNHDDANMFYYSTTYNQKQNVSDVLYPFEQFNRISKHGLTNGNNKNYFYADISGIRFVVLYQKDYDYTDGIPQNLDFKIGADQLTWLTNTALDTELPVVVLTHAPLISELYPTGGTGFSDAVTAINNFVSGGGTVIAVLSGHVHEQGSQKKDGINHIMFANGYGWFELISIDLTNRTISCKAINKTLADISATF